MDDSFRPSFDRCRTATAVRYGAVQRCATAMGYSDAAAVKDMPLVPCAGRAASEVRKRAHAVRAR